MPSFPSFEPPAYPAMAVKLSPSRLLDKEKSEREREKEKADAKKRN